MTRALALTRQHERTRAAADECVRMAVDAATFAAVMDAVEDCPLSVRKRVAAALRGEAAHG
ncbi:hypothetical protein EYE35_01035 [Cereibacter sphaeroides]|nr:hypothetical protein EYE35_01035 [Cereibacter sphaeroides]